MDSTTAVVTGSIGILSGLYALWTIISPAIASWVTATMNKADGWLGSKPNYVKTVFYFILNWVAQLLGAFGHYAVSSNMATVDYSQVFWTGLIGAVGGTVIYKIGHKTPTS